MEATTVQHWRARGDACLAAVARLPGSDPAMAWPRAELLRQALQCQLKAFLCAARGGAPDSSDVGRLVTLSRHCGLELTADELAAIAGLCAGAVDPAQQAAMEALCRLISQRLESPLDD